MADRILSVQYLTASSAGTEIDLPRLWDKAANFGGYNQGYKISGSDYFPADQVKYLFNDHHSGTIELTQNQGDVAGIYIPADTIFESDGFRLRAEPPRFLYSPKASGEPCRVTVILVR